jgi:hypothetical protein
MNRSRAAQIVASATVAVCRSPGYSRYRDDDGFGQETTPTLTRMEVPLWTM